MNRALYSVVAIAIGVIIVGVLAIPLMDDLSVSYDREPQTPNTGSYFYDLGGAHTASYDGTTLTVDGETVAAPANVVSLLASEKLQVIYTADGLDAYSWDTPGTTTTTALDGSWSMTVTSAGAVSITGDVSLQATMDEFLFLSPEGGEYVLSSRGPIAVNDGVDVYFVGLGSAARFAVTDEASSGTVQGTHSGETMTVNWEASESEGIVTISGFETSYNTVTHLAQAIVPVDYYKLIEVESDNSMFFGIISMLLVVVPLMMAVRLIGGRE